MSIVAALGYPMGTLEPPLDSLRQTRADDILARLVLIDNALTDSSLRSMATRMDDLELSYGQNIAALKAEGSRLLDWLASISGLEVQHDPYAASSLPLSFRAFP